MIDKKVLDETLRKHSLWSNKAEGGEIANLRGANLCEADLSGADLSGADLRGANLRLTGFLVIGHIGSRNDITYYHHENDLVRCGCFSGTLSEFEKAVHEKYDDGKCRKEYDAAIAFIKSVMNKEHLQ